MNLSKSPAAYDAADQDRMRGTLELEDKRNLKAGTVFDKISTRDTALGTIRTAVITNGVWVIS